MSIQSEITRIQNNVNDSFNAVQELGVTVQSTDTSNELSTRIREIGGKYLPLEGGTMSGNIGSNGVHQLSGFNVPSLTGGHNGGVIVDTADGIKESGLQYKRITKTDNSGYLNVFLIAQIDDWMATKDNGTEGIRSRGFTGTIYESRDNGNLYEKISHVVCRCSYKYDLNREQLLMLTTDNDRIVPCIARYQNHYYLALQVKRSGRDLDLFGHFFNCLSPFIEVLGTDYDQCSDVTVFKQGKVISYGEVSGNYLPLTGGELSGDVSINKSSGTLKNIQELNNASGLTTFTLQSYTDHEGNDHCTSTSSIQIISGIDFDSDEDEASSIQTEIKLNADSVQALNIIKAQNGFYQTSDIRKKNIHEEISLDKAYDLIDKCQSILYDLKDDDQHKVQLGLIAQEVEEFFPEIIITDQEGFKSLDYSRLTVIILRVLKDLISRISKLEK